MKTLKFLPIVPILLILAVSCGETTDTNIADGWAAFKVGNYEEAQDFFEAALTTDAKAANEGLGWVSMRLGQLPTARSFFLTSAGVDADTLVGTMAGLAIVSWSQGQYQESINAASFVLSRQSTFVFPYDETIVANTMRLIQAYDYYYLGQFTNCSTRIQQIDTAFPATTDPQALLNKLDALSRSLSLS